MKKIIEVRNTYHLGDNIINFIFFRKIKNYIESNNIIIHYYCHTEYHKNILDFNFSNNIIILAYENRGYVLWQGFNTPKLHYIEDALCAMFNNFLHIHNIPISVDSFEYQDDDLFKRLALLDVKYKDIDILIINSFPRSCQYNYDKVAWDNFIIRLTSKYKIATTLYVNDDILSLDDISVKNIAAMALNVKKIIAIDTGPSIPLYNTDILNNVEDIYLFNNVPYSFNTRKITVMSDIENLSFLL